MKYLLLLLLFLTLLNAQDKQKLTIGLGAYAQTQPYTDVDTILLPSPVIFFDNSLFYIRWSRAGVYFLGDKGEDFSWGLSLTIQPRTFGYSPDDTPLLKGMDERENTFEGGLAFSMAYEDAYLETMLVTDVLDRHDSWILKTEIGDEYTLGSFSFYPSLILTYQSSKFLNYYYGVTQEEASRTSFSYYKADDGLQVGIQTYIRYPLHKDLAILVNMRADRIPISAQNSPLIEENFIYSGLLSLIYTFEY